MTPVPLDQLRWRDHTSALWWLGLLYRRPRQFEETTEAYSRWRKITVAVQLYLHFFPYLVVLCVLSRVVLFGLLGLEAETIHDTTAASLLWHLETIAGGIAFGIAGGIAGGIAVLRAYYLIYHPFFVWPQVRPHWYPYHPVAWDDLCAVPFFRFDRLLVAYTEYAPEAGEAEIERLITSYPSQRLAALRTRTTLLAREAARVTDLTRLSGIVERLPEGDSGFLGQTPSLRDLVHEIVTLQIRLDTLTRPILREPTAQLLTTTIENFRHQISGFHEPLASEFRAAATQWLALAQRRLQETRAALTAEPQPQVFRAGDPVNRDQEAFVPRDAVVGALDKQIMLSTGCPGIILYGRRRMGKSTVLRNLTGFLPTNVVVVALSMQNPEAFTSLASFVSLIAKQLRAALPDNELPSVVQEDLPGLFRLLTHENQRAEDAGRRVLLAIDEYENIDNKIAAEVFPQDLLATVRESIQSHRSLTWLFAGSHQITELTAAPWTSYLVSARTIEVPSFTLAETRLLLTEPLKHSSLWEKNATNRPYFTPEFWGDGGIERIHHEAGGWPHLVQLIAETTIDVLNDEGNGAVSSSLLERALEKAIVSGDTVLTELLRRESQLPGEWEYLSKFRARETQPPPSDEAVYMSLRRRLLVENRDGEWCLRVPLMARWLRERG